MYTSSPSSFQAQGPKRLSILLCCIALGCTPRGDDDVGKHTITVLWEASAGELDPRFALNAYSAKINRLLFSRLVSIDNEASEPRFDLATALHQPDPLTYELEIRQGVRFHDGQLLSAEDVVYTYQSVLDPALKSPLSGMFKSLESVEAISPSRVRFRLKRAHAPFLTNLEIGIVPRHRVGADGRQPGPPVGSGPFRWGSGDGDQRITLLRNESWYGPAPKIERVVFRTIRDDNSRLLALMGGSGDLIQNGVSPLMVPVLAERPNLKIESGPSVACSYIGFNLEDPGLAKVQVRRAIAHAIDRRRIIEHKFAGRARPATGLLAPGHWAYNGDVALYPYDPDRAKALLDAAGYPDPDGDGPQPRFALTYKTSTNRFRRAVALVIAHYLQQVGIEVEVKAYEWGTFFHDIRSGNFQLYSLQWPVVVEPDLYHWIFHSSMIPTEENRGRGANRGRYRSARADALIEQGRIETDKSKRRALYGRLQAVMAEDLPYVPLWHDDNIAVMQRAVQGWRILPNARFAALTEVSRSNP